MVRPINAMAAQAPRKLRGGLDVSPRETRPANKSQRLHLGQLKPRKLLALDTETTGGDLWHGCKPFFVSVLDADGNLQHWEWDVNPLTRDIGFYTATNSGPKAQDSPYGEQSFVPTIPDLQREQLTKLITENDLLLHNTKFDVRALSTHGLPEPDWNTLHDTLIASHVLVSNESHKLKDLALQYLNIPDDDEKALQDAVNEARRYGRQLGWRIADEGDPYFPAWKANQNNPGWKLDFWLPRAVAKYFWSTLPKEPVPAVGSPQKKPSRSSRPAKPKDPKQSAHYWRPPGTNGGDDPGHPWWDVLKTYALRDVERTYGYWLMAKDALEDEGATHFYEERRQNLEAIYRMEDNGVTISKPRIKEMSKRVATDAAKAEKLAFKLAPSKIDNLDSSKQMQMVLFGDFKLKPTKETKTGFSTDKDVMLRLYERSQGKAHDFIHNTILYRKNNKAGDYLDEYQTRSVPLHPMRVSGLPIPTDNRLDLRGGGIAGDDRQPVPGDLDFILLHGSFNPTGTDTTRLSSSGPNLQNIGKQVDPLFGDFNLRRIFGPTPGREWYSIDYNNIELRIFAYESGDVKLIEAYEQGFAVHCIFAEILHPKEYAACRKECAAQVGDQGPATAKLLRKATENLFKSRYESTLYQWTKNGNFSLIYGAGQEKADTTYHVPGAYHIIRQKLPLIDEFLANKHHEARTYGYVRILPKNPIDKKPAGYKLYVSTREPHKAVNYFVQGSAGWCMTLALNRIHRYLKELNESIARSNSRSIDGVTNSPTYKMIMTIHDEIVFDFPCHPRNTEVISKVSRLMEQSGVDIGVPTPVDVELHKDNWAEGEKVKLLAA